jgi:hypothetical protein
MLKLRQLGFSDGHDRGLAESNSAPRGAPVLARPSSPRRGLSLPVCAAALYTFLTESVTDPRRFEP